MAGTTAGIVSLILHTCTKTKLLNNESLRIVVITYYTILYLLHLQVDCHLIYTKRNPHRNTLRIMWSILRCNLLILLLLKYSSITTSFTSAPTFVSPVINRHLSSRLYNVQLQQEPKLVDSIQTKKTYLDDGFVFGLEGSGIERPKGKEPLLVIEGDELETKPYQVAMVVSTFAFHTFLCFTSIQQMFQQNQGDFILTALQLVAVFLSSWILADFGSGVLHWSVDNYGNGRTPVMGGIIAAFQGHHSAPWTITYREFCNNVYKLCIPFGIGTMALISIFSGSDHPMSTLNNSSMSMSLFCLHIFSIVS